MNHLSEGLWWLCVCSGFIGFFNGSMEGSPRLTGALTSACVVLGFLAIMLG